MLTEEQKFKNKQVYLGLLNKLGLDLSNFTKYLDNERVDYFNKPYTLHPDTCYSGSLCEHALSIYNHLMFIANTYMPGKYNEADIIKVALLKDIYRAELFTSYIRNVKSEVTGKWEATVAYKTKEEKDRPIFGDVGFSSYMIAKKFFNLDNDELVEAICYSYIANTQNLPIDIYTIRKDYKLVALTTIAELASASLELPTETKEVASIGE